MMQEQAITNDDWKLLPVINTDKVTVRDLFRPCYLLARLEEQYEGAQIKALPCSLVNFTARTLTVRFTPTVREEFNLAPEYVTCDPKFLRWASPEDTERTMAHKESYDDGY